RSGDSVVRGRATAGGAAVAPSARLLCLPLSDAATTAPENPGNPPGLAARGSTAAAGLARCGRPALARSLPHGIAWPSHSAVRSRATLSRPDGTPRFSPAVGYGSPPHHPHTATPGPG